MKPVVLFIGSRVEARRLSSYGSATEFNFYKPHRGVGAAAPAPALAAPRAAAVQDVAVPVEFEKSKTLETRK